MKKLVLTLAIAFASLTALFAQTWVGGYYRNNGTFVQGHYRSQSNHTNWNNYSTVGNTNPFNNLAGNRAADYSSNALTYGSGNTIYSGSRGGQYYINSNGNKTYVPKRNGWGY